MLRQAQSESISRNSSNLHPILISVPTGLANILMRNEDHRWQNQMIKDGYFFGAAFTSSFRSLNRTSIGPPAWIWNAKMPRRDILR